MLVAPRIVNDVSYVTRIDDASHFAWQAQYLVRLLRWAGLLLMTYVNSTIYLHTYLTVTSIS